MDRSALRTIAIICFCVGIIAVSAATLDSTKTIESGGEGTGESAGLDRGNGSGMGVGNRSGTGMGRAVGGNGTDKEVKFDWICVRELTNPMLQLAFLFGVLGIGLVEGKRKTRIFGIGAVVLLLVLGFLAYLLLTGGCQTTTVEWTRIQGGGPSGGGGTPGVAGGEGSDLQPTFTTWPLLFGGVAVVGIALALWASSDRTLDSRSGGEDEVPAGEGSSSGVGIDAVGRAAGRAADRIESSDEFDNEVYRAWAEMATTLEVDHPDSSTPAEFATAAVDAGMDRGDVDRLTRLFEDVRYGGRSPTPDRERAAVETLRRIEDQYADGGGDGE